MRTELTRIGNSRGIRIPKPLIDQCGLGNVVELRVTAAGLVIAPHRAPRHGWRQQFDAAGPDNNALLLAEAPANLFDSEEWKW
ncbi:MAG TPA: AbrB/MazE/SpoVT family DNA-binding domain-containing protein [Candidatus Sulfotelmatobacter sp.]|nr:AbrB/MazE/SpoVT family DNA-binding domain-containing protein [Candidatus Sulfotelmatobacter sp.]